ncbi:MAG: electron-transfer flavoprotein:ubiquinone oxidoreductase [Phycisphaerae bacterium]|nr:electron-transfer flavoprotein:ubiquinone oxidoreductase [Phycisphaerae bacterium]MDD5380697.1 electron-transfer flavoprotein:ubiquinone oxidoreductase [Phycisphaerae bacterium]
MSNDKDYNKTDVLIVGAGPAGLACAIRLKAQRPNIDVCVIEKAADLGNHNLSGAALEAESLHTLLDSAVQRWQDSASAKDVLANKVSRDDVMFFLGKRISFNISLAIKLAKIFRLGFGQMIHKGDYIVSVSKLTKWMGQIAKELGVEVLTGFAAEDIIFNESIQQVKGIKLVSQGFDKSGQKQPNFIEGETIDADFIVLAEGCDGLLTEKFIQKAGLKRQCPQLYSVGVKELIKVSGEQYSEFTSGRVVHAMGYPLWTPVLGPGMFGGGVMYPAGDNNIAVGMIVGADWKYCDFNPEDALTNFKNHSFVKRFIAGGVVLEAGAKMIPEGGYYAIPRDPQTGSIGKGNCIIVGDSAGFVNMLKIKGLHNAICSGIAAAKAIAETRDLSEIAAARYTELIDSSNVAKEMASARNFRQTVAKFGALLGMPISVLGGFLPKFKIEEDYKAMTAARYKLKPEQQFDKDTFTAMAATRHREEQPSHLKILDSIVCRTKCTPKFESPCITFCPAGVYETVHDEVKPANPSNCVHCKTCQRKCPFDNIRWTVPEGSGGPRYKRM